MVESDFYRWRYYLFFSVDLINSTAFKAGRVGKQSFGDQRDNWAKPFEDFYKEFPESFDQEFTRAINEFYEDYDYDTCLACEHPTPWKFMGDEVLLTAEIKDSKLIPVYLASFKNTLKSHSKVLREIGLGCKGTVWSAGFPVINRIIKVGNLTDYLGPSIDTGFRLARFSTERKLTVSLEVFMMANHYITQCNRNENDELRFYFDGMEQLKGVLSGGRGYPIIWLDVASKHARLKEYPEEYLAIPQQIKQPDGENFCHFFIKQNETLLIRPFIDGDRGSAFSDIPLDHKRRLDKLRNIQGIKGDLNDREGEAVTPSSITLDSKMADDIHESLRSILLQRLRKKEPPTSDEPL